MLTGDLIGIKSLFCCFWLLFDYCSLVWDTCSNYLIENLQKLQNRAARVISGKSYEIRSCEILSELGWRPLAERMKFKKATFMYNVKNNNLNEPMTDIFEVCNNEFHNLRSMLLISIFLSLKPIF